MSQSKEPMAVEEIPRYPGDYFCLDCKANIRPGHVNRHLLSEEHHRHLVHKI